MKHRKHKVIPLPEVKPESMHFALDVAFDSMMENPNHRKAFAKFPVKRGFFEQLGTYFQTGKWPTEMKEEEKGG